MASLNAATQQKVLEERLTPAAIKYTPEAYRTLEEQIEQMRADHQLQIFGSWSEGLKDVQQIEREFVKAVGDPTKAHQQVILLSAKAAGDAGVALGDLRRYISDPNHLNKAREALLEPKDEDGSKLPPLIKEDRGENNELRIFLPKAEDAGTKDK
jgi:hypothetical protein